MQVLLLAGNAGVGKDTAAEILKQLFGARPLAQAAKLKQLAEAFGFSPEQLYGPSEYRNAVDPRYVDETSPHWAIAEHAIKGDLGEQWLDDVLPYADATATYEGAFRALCAWFDRLKVQALAAGGLSPRLVLQTLGTEFGRVVLGPDVWSRYAFAEAEVMAQQGVPLVVITDGRFPNEIRNVRERGGKVLHLVAPTTTAQAFSSHVSEQSLNGFTEFDYTLPNPKVSRDHFAADLVRAINFLFPSLTRKATYHG